MGISSQTIHAFGESNDMILCDLGLMSLPERLKMGNSLTDWETVLGFSLATICASSVGVSACFTDSSSQESIVNTEFTALSHNPALISAFRIPALIHPSD